MTGRAKLFWRLMVRPIGREPVRMGLTILAVALGVAVLLAMDLAGTAATGSFRSSLETLTGHYNFEVTATGGVPEEIVGRIATSPINLAISPRMEDFAVVAATKKSVVLLGLDLVGEAEAIHLKSDDGASPSAPETENIATDFSADDSIWAGSSLGWQKGQHVSLIIGDRERTFTVRGTYDDQNQPAIVMDIAAAQRTVGRAEKVDRILIAIPESENLEAQTRQISALLPAGAEIRSAGTATDENRKMLAAFRWNLKLLSYIALIVAAFLIYNTISVSVVRRRPETGIVRALGAGRGAVLAAFIGEAAFFGLAGAALGLPVGRVMASGAVKLMAATVESLYVSRRPGAIALSAWSVALAFVIGVGVAILSAYSPAREASFVSPVEAMARGRREYIARAHKSRDLWLAVILGILAAVAARVPAVEGKPVFGYLAAILLVIASALAIPAFTDAVISRSSRWLGKILGVEALLASQSLSAALRRTSVL